MSYLEPKYSRKLFGLESKFLYFKQLIDTNNFPKVSLLSGKKGAGKYTLFNHLLNNIFDSEYDYKNYEINPNSQVNNLISKDLFSNVVYLGSKNGKHLSIDEIRAVKKNLQKTSLNDMPRFVVIDDIETLNINCINSLLKLIEEPPKNNFFILINNLSNKLSDTIKSRCLEFKFFLKEEEKNNIINSLITYHDLKTQINYKSINITPGNFILYNHLIEKNEVNFEDDIKTLLEIFLQLFKKNKDKTFIDLSVFAVEHFIISKIRENNSDIASLDKLKVNLLKDIKDFGNHSLNLKLVLNSISNRIA